MPEAIRGGSCGSAADHWTIFRLPNAFRGSSAEPWKVLTVWYGLAAGGHALRFAPTHHEQPVACRHHDGSYARHNGGVDDGDDAVTAICHAMEFMRPARAKPVRGQQAE